MIISHSEPFGLRYKKYPGKDVRIYKVLSKNMTTAKAEVKTRFKKRKVAIVDAEVIKPYDKTKLYHHYFVYVVML